MFMFMYDMFVGGFFYVMLVGDLIMSCLWEVSFVSWSSVREWSFCG